jgi:hypothetical protein
MSAPFRQSRSVFDRLATPMPGEGRLGGHIHRRESDLSHRDDDPFSLREAFEQYRTVMRQVDRHIAEAEGDKPLQEFWRGVKHKYREEADRLSRRIGEEADTPSMIDF